MLQPILFLVNAGGNRLISTIIAALLFISVTTVGLTDTQIYGLPPLLILGYIILGYLRLITQDLQTITVQLNGSDTDPSAEIVGPLSTLALLITTHIKDRERKNSETAEIVDEISYSVEELSNNASNVAQNTDQQSQATASTAAAVTQISHSVEEVTRHIGDTLTAARSARDLSVEGIGVLVPTRNEVTSVAQLASETSSLFATLRTRSDKISSMSEFIRDLSDQTNLLALNAAIEAARAGEHGRGFSVVAEEVRALAQRSHGASVEISSVINGIQQQMNLLNDQMEAVVSSSERCVENTNQVEQALNDITERTEMVSDQISQVAAAVEQQESATRDISQHIEQVAAVAQSNSDMAGETARVARHIANLTHRSTTGGAA